MSGAVPLRHDEAVATDLPPQRRLRAAVESSVPVDRPATTGWWHRARSIPAGRAAPRRLVTDLRPIQYSTGTAERNRAATADAAGKCPPEAIPRRRRSASLRGTRRALAPVAYDAPTGWRSVSAHSDQVFRPSPRCQA